MQTREPYRWYADIPEDIKKVGLDTSDSQLRETEGTPNLTSTRPYESGYVGNILPVSSIQEQTDQELIYRSKVQLMRHSFDQYDLEVVEQGSSQVELALRQRQEYAENTRVHYIIATVVLALGISLIVYIDRLR